LGREHAIGRAATHGEIVADHDHGAAVDLAAADPKLDPVTGELIFFGYGVGAPFSAGMSYGISDASVVLLVSTASRRLTLLWCMTLS
jgi:hypothetical protein